MTALVEIVKPESALRGQKGILIGLNSVEWFPGTRADERLRREANYEQPFLNDWLKNGSVQVVEGRWGTWDAPATDHLPVIETPVGVPCTYCRELIAVHDKGGAVTRGMGPHHRECALRAVMGGVGHHVDHAKYCKSKLGTDAGLSYRDSALLVWDIYVEHRTITEALLSARRDHHGPEGH